MVLINLFIVRRVKHFSPAEKQLNVNIAVSGLMHYLMENVLCLLIDVAYVVKSKFGQPINRSQHVRTYILNRFTSVWI